MQSSPNRERVLGVRMWHCAQCNPTIWRVVDGSPLAVHKRRGAVGVGRRDKPKGQHEYRKGRVV